MSDKVKDNSPNVEYLERAGWSYDGSGWRMPRSWRVVKDIEHTIRKRGGQEQTIRQAVVPPADWSYKEEQAVNMQKARDVAEAA